jgi:hypothetical protein
MNRDELVQLETYLRKTFQNNAIEVRARPTKKVSAGGDGSDEVVGVFYRDVEDGEGSDQFQMAILEFDLAS